jgi:hypothetical protein
LIAAFARTIEGMKEISLLLVSVFFAIVAKPAVAQDFAPGVEQRITRDSGEGHCIGDARSPACALETLFACMIREDRDMCRGVGVDPNTDCDAYGLYVTHYVIEQVYGLDVPRSWPRRLTPVSEHHRYARIVYSSYMCAEDREHLCADPITVEYQEAVRVNGKWTLVPMQPGKGPLAYEKHCFPADT